MGLVWGVTVIGIGIAVIAFRRRLAPQFDRVFEEFMVIRANALRPSSALVPVGTIAVLVGAAVALAAILR